METNSVGISEDADKHRGWVEVRQICVPVQLSLLRALTALLYECVKMSSSFLACTIRSV